MRKMNKRKRHKEAIASIFAALGFFLLAGVFVYIPFVNHEAGAGISRHPWGNVPVITQYGIAALCSAASGAAFCREAYKKFSSK